MPHPESSVWKKIEPSSTGTCRVVVNRSNVYAIVTAWFCRYGFNNHGHKIVFRNIKNAFFFRLGPLGVNLGANKTSANVIDDYVQGLVTFQEVADFYVINVSSPNTAGLRSMQQNDKLQGLLTAVRSPCSRMRLDVYFES